VPPAIFHDEDVPRLGSLVEENVFVWRSLSMRRDTIRPRSSFVLLAALGCFSLTLFGGARQANADLIGLTVDAKLYIPDLKTLQQDYGTQVVNPTAFFSLSFTETTTITGTQIIYTSPTISGTYLTASFNGYVFDFLNSGNLITKLTVDPSSTLSGFNPSFATLTSDGAGGQLVGVNLGQGLNYSSRATVVLDVTTSAVPEPSSLVLANAAGLCCLGRWLGKRRWMRGGRRNKQLRKQLMSVLSGPCAESRTP
jgi:hypothetical protein